RPRPSFVPSPIAATNLLRHSPSLLKSSRLLWSRSPWSLLPKVEVTGDGQCTCWELPPRQPSPRSVLQSFRNRAQRKPASPLHALRTKPAALISTVSPARSPTPWSPHLPRKPLAYTE